VAFRHTRLAVVMSVVMVIGAGSMAHAGAVGTKRQPAVGHVRIVNPYAQVPWERVEYLHSFSHQHGGDPQVFWDMGFGHLPISNYYPSRPFYPLPEAFLKKHPDALGAPNAEQHSTTDSGFHFCSLGSFYTVGYGQTPRIPKHTAPIEHVFSGLNVFDAQRSPWLGVYRLDLRMASAPGSNQRPAVALTIEGAVELNRKTFALQGDGLVHARRLTEKSPEAMYLRTTSDAVRVRLDFDPATTQITRFRMMQGTNRPWRDAFRAALDGTRKDAAGRPIEGLLYPDGGGITINHPQSSLKLVLEALDFDPRVLGIEVWNQHRGFGGPQAGFYRLWDEVLRAGRPCFGFFVKDHMFFGRGRNVLLMAEPATAGRQEREHAALRTYREGRFFGLVGALAVDQAGRVTAPYDHTAFRFTRIAVQETAAHEPAGVEVAVTGADRSKRPQTQIRFVTEAGVAQVANGERAYFAFPRDAAGAIRCRYVRVEAFAYPRTHLGGQPLTTAAFTALTVHDISRLHDRTGPFPTSHLDPSGQAPLAIVDMLFSQPIRIVATP
jgi:hypothetical protein